MLAIYSNADYGDLIVLKSDLSSQLNRLRTGMDHADELIWCGNDVTALIYNGSNKVIFVSPSNESLALDLDFPKTYGLKCLTEVDGLRIVTSVGTYFVELVQE